MLRLGLDGRVPGPRGPAYTAVPRRLGPAVTVAAMRMSLGTRAAPTVAALLRLAGAVLVLAGLYLVARFLPEWFWGVLAGAALLALGWRLASAR